MIRACLDGINLYSYNPEQNTLRGCVNDAHNLLAKWKEDLGDFLVFLDKRATKQAIFAGWRELRDKCAPGDTLRLTQSSHGIEEGICCYNLGVKNGEWDPNGFISYLEVNEFCAEIPESILVEFIIDACHCERHLRELGRVYGKAKYMQMFDTPLVATRTPVQPVIHKSNVIVWAACEPDQTSADAYIGNQPQGAFTAAFIEADVPGRIRSDVIFYAKKWLGKNGYDQVPHLYANHDHAMEVMI